MGSMFSQFFGKDTHRAILAFQLENDLVVDGLVGLKTWAKLLEKKNLLTNFNAKTTIRKRPSRFCRSVRLGTGPQSRP